MRPWMYQSVINIPIIYLFAIKRGHIILSTQYILSTIVIWEALSASSMSHTCIHAHLQSWDPSALRTSGPSKTIRRELVGYSRYSLVLRQTLYTMPTSPCVAAILPPSQQKISPEVHFAWLRPRCQPWGLWEGHLTQKPSETVVVWEVQSPACEYSVDGVPMVLYFSLTRPQLTTYQSSSINSSRCSHARCHDSVLHMMCILAKLSWQKTPNNA